MTAKTTEAGGERGDAAGKKVKGRTRHIIVDTLGVRVLVVAHRAAIPDRDGACIWADGGDAGGGWTAPQAGGAESSTS